MALTGHKYNLNEKSLAKIEYLMPRLKYSVLPSKIIKWLENFNEDEVDLALDLLRVFEYIPFNEFMFRIDDLLFRILKDIPDNEKVIVFPYGKVGKSGTLVTYPLKNTTTFKKRENNILITHDIKYVDDLSDYKHIIFIDDFIGSGDTFIEEYKKVKCIDNWKKYSKFKRFFLLSSIIMEEGKSKIEVAFSEIEIFAEVRGKIFENGKSPLTVFKNVLPLKTISYKYGKLISPQAPLGFRESQSLISFFHGTPDNTLPIIWVSDKKWEAIFPRDPKTRMDEARAFKSNIAYYIGISNRLGIDLFTGRSIIEKIDDKYKRKIPNNSKYAHSIVALLFLKKKEYDNLIISHILGLTREELKRVYLEARMKGLLDIHYNLNDQGLHFLKKIEVETKKENIRVDSTENLTKRLNDLYMPETFKGLT